MSMGCTEVGELIEAFVDSELPPEELLQVARHAGQCGRCDGVVRDLLAVREAVIADTSRLIDGVDLSRVWAGVDAAITRTDGQAEWRRRGEARRATFGGRRVTIWGSMAAIAAGVALFVGMPPGGERKRVAVTQPPTQIAKNKRIPNHVIIDQLAGKDITLKRDDQKGGTMIWVNHEVERSGW
jgi:anti-sigma factor RsiW